MNSEDLMKDILNCLPGHSDGSIEVGHIFMPQHVAAYLMISPMQAKELLNSLCDVGYLEYEAASVNKLSGYHLTEKGYNFYTK